MPFATAKYFVARRQRCQHEVGQVQILEQGEQVSGLVYVFSHPEIRWMLHQRQSAHYIHHFGAHCFVFDIDVADINIIFIINYYVTLYERTPRDIIIL